MPFDSDQLSIVRSVAFVVADSLRWDSFAQAKTPLIDRWASWQEKRFSYASWTQPSHACLLTGILPHSSEPGVLASTAYAVDFAFWTAALAPGEAIESPLHPEFCLALMAKRLGWRTIGRVAMPVLNENTQFSRGFEDYALLPQGGNLGSQIESLAPLISPREKNFVFINAGETHYPYVMPAGSLPHLSGANGTLRRATPPLYRREVPFTAEQFAELHQSQIRGAELFDRRLEQLVELLPKPLLLVVTSDHGELFGEGGYFGHGPFFHQLLFEVPLAMGIVT